MKHLRKFNENLENIYDKEYYCFICITKQDDRNAWTNDSLDTITTTTIIHFDKAEFTDRDDDYIYIITESGEELGFNLTEFTNLEFNEMDLNYTNEWFIYDNKEKAAIGYKLLNSKVEDSLKQKIRKAKDNLGDCVTTKEETIRKYSL